MRTIAKLFSRSPFVPLQAHMDRVGECVQGVRQIIDAYERGDREQVEALAKEISRLEHAADQVKDDIRNSLPRGLFLQVDRGNLLEILGIQDSLADAAENIGVLLTFKAMHLPDGVRDHFRAFLAKNVECFDAAARIIKEIDELVETGFGGHEAEKVKQMVHDVAFKEHEADVIQRDLLKAIFAHEAELTHGDFFLWTKIIPEIAKLSNLSEKLANRVRMMLEIK